MIADLRSIYEVTTRGLFHQLLSVDRAVGQFLLTIKCFGSGLFLVLSLVPQVVHRRLDTFTYTTYTW